MSLGDEEAGDAVPCPGIDEFPHKGIPTEAELALCKDFAKLVASCVDDAYTDLLAGNVASWKGARIATFLGLLERESGAAVVHAGNAIEERVYALLAERDPGVVRWTPQHSEAMGGASRPDIVINLSETREALIDITSERGHILRKAGNWTGSERYVYVAEAYFPPVQKQHMEIIRKGVKDGGLRPEDVERMRAAADAERRAQEEAKALAQKAARDEFNRYGNFSAYVSKKFGGDRNAALKELRSHGLQVKGMPKLKGKRRPSEETRAKMRAKAAAVRKQKREEGIARARGTLSEDSGDESAGSSSAEDMMDVDE
jgi:hypothetical protein